MEEPEDLRRAPEPWQETYRDQRDGELDRAMERYPAVRRSLHHRGGAHLRGLGPEHPGRLDEAIEECRRAIGRPPMWQSI
jgi:hypothetical protein